MRLKVGRIDREALHGRRAAEHVAQSSGREHLRNERNCQGAAVVAAWAARQDHRLSGGAQRCSQATVSDGSVVAVAHGPASRKQNLALAKLSRRNRRNAEGRLDARGSVRLGEAQGPHGRPRQVGRHNRATLQVGQTHDPHEADDAVVVRLGSGGLCPRCRVFRVARVRRGGRVVRLCGSSCLAPVLGVHFLHHCLVLEHDHGLGWGRSPRPGVCEGPLDEDAARADQVHRISRLQCEAPGLGGQPLLRSDCVPASRRKHLSREAHPNGRRNRNHVLVLDAHTAGGVNIDDLDWQPHVHARVEVLRQAALGDALSPVLKARGPHLVSVRLVESRCRV
mmetsp:Transcript_267/g.808  ORF Transcript_267/g.808 Transcript_267/m.808 type:complete len:337 (+) Transcript_267:9592-10602(+)